MRFSVVLIVLVLAPSQVMSLMQEDDVMPSKKYFHEIQKLREQGKTWKKVEEIMGIWSSEDDEQVFPEHIEPKGRQAGRQADTTANPYDIDPAKSQMLLSDLQHQMYMSEAENAWKFLEILQNHPPRDMKYALPVARYVSTLEDDTILDVRDDD